MNSKATDFVKKAEESMLSWMLNSGVCIKDLHHPAYGGVHAGYDVRSRRWLFIFSEITGYAISMFCAQYRATGEERYLNAARASASFLMRYQMPAGSIAVAGSFPEGLRVPDLAPMPRRFTFDAAMCIQGLLDLYQITKDAALRESAKLAGNWILSMQDPAGFFLSYYDSETGSNEHPGPLFYEDAGCLHAKHAIALLKLHAVTGDPKYQIAARKVCDWVLSLQDVDGAFWVNHSKSHVYTHAHCYATEGLFFAFEQLRIPAYGNAIRRACDWLDTRIDKRYGVLGTHKVGKFFRPTEASTPRRLFQLLRRVFPRKEIATDATIQSARLFLYRYLLGDYDQGLDKAKIIMQTLVPRVLYDGEDLSAKGGLYSRLDISLGLARPSPIIATWGVLFALQVCLLLDKDKIGGAISGSSADQMAHLF